MPLCLSAGAKKQHVLAFRGCSRNVLSFPNRKKHLEITRDSGLNNTEGRGCCGVKGKAKGLSSVSLIPQKALGNVGLIKLRYYIKLGWFHSIFGGQKFKKGKSNQYWEVFGLKKFVMQNRQVLLELLIQTEVKRDYFKAFFRRI